MKETKKVRVFVMLPTRVEIEGSLDEYGQVDIRQVRVDSIQPDVTVRKLMEHLSEDEYEYLEGHLREAFGFQEGQAV